LEAIIKNQSFNLQYLRKESFEERENQHKTAMLNIRIKKNMPQQSFCPSCHITVSYDILYFVAN